MSLIEKLKTVRKRAQNAQEEAAGQIIPTEPKKHVDEAIIAEIRENIQAQISALRQLDTAITKYIETRD